ncbi:hypothetical protein T484DRAFT_2027878 [Baffinella frigidus]|nr:hypothetical protein T484DRAFT_2027918 [Cryptophyta sp. CCMP2293]KAJ1465143.1 hypothetical protein T484DRAFT_2027878 [Cryptophyta sp. CCMP2293]
MPWRDVIFTGDSIILPPSWTQPGINHATSCATGGIELPPSVSEEERVLLDLLLAQPETRCQAKPQSPVQPANATGESNDDALSTATTPALSRCSSFEMYPMRSQSRRSSAVQEL